MSRRRQLARDTAIALLAGVLLFVAFDMAGGWNWLRSLGVPV